MQEHNVDASDVKRIRLRKVRSWQTLPFHPVQISKHFLECFSPCQNSCWVFQRGVLVPGANRDSSAAHVLSSPPRGHARLPETPPRLD